MIRKAVEADSFAISSLIVSSWQTAYRGLIDNSFLDNMTPEESLDRWKNNINSQNDDSHIYVYSENDKILGVIRYGEPDGLNDKYNSEIHVLYVEPTLKRTGIGSKLFDFAKQYFIKTNKTKMIIWCLKGNIPSIKFYEKMGGTIVTSKSNIVHGIAVEEVGLEYNLID